MAGPTMPGLLRSGTPDSRTSVPAEATSRPLGWKATVVILRSVAGTDGPGTVHKRAIPSTLLVTSRRSSCRHATAVTGSGCGSEATMVRVRQFHSWTVLAALATAMRSPSELNAMA